MVLVLGFSSLNSEEPLSFNRDVRPILSDRCFKCHGPDASNSDSDFRLDSFKHITQDLGGYFGVVPGNLDKSELHKRIHSRDKNEQMPPPGSLRGLSEKEKRILDRWILEGASYEGHWAFQSIPKKITPPDLNSDWGRGLIDQFVLRKIKSLNLKPNREASKEKWLRRVTFDLTGLPPTISELEVFLKDSSKDAFEKVVDRLLKTDASSERLTSEWLDVARYSDTLGYQRDDERFVWPWRDWVIKAFKENMPFDQFITWQLAGDLFPKATREQKLATTFNRLHSHKKEGGVALEEFRIENVADRTHTMASAFMGLTLECSRCHDHKYDPITMKDYYQLTSFFANIDERGLISYFTDAVPTPAMPFPSKEQESQLRQAEARILKIEEALNKTHSEAKEKFENWLRDWRKQELNQDEFESFYLPGKVADLSFESFASITKEESKNEEGKNVPPKKMQTLENHVENSSRAITSKENLLVPGISGHAIRLTGDDSVVLPKIGHYGRHQSFSISLWINTSEVDQRAVIFRRSRGWDDAGSIGYELTKEGALLSAKMVHFWPGNALCVETTTPLVPGRWYHVVFTYDGSSQAKGLKLYLDGQPAKTVIQQDSLTRTITQWRYGYPDLAIGSRYRDRGFKGGKVDEFKVFERSLTEIEVEHLFDGRKLDALRRKSPSSLTSTERAQLFQYFVTNFHSSSLKNLKKLSEVRKDLNTVKDAIPGITIMREQSKPRPAYILTRGAYNQRGKQVFANTPAFLPGFPKDAPRNRLGLAKWLTSSEHPLTARVTVNRYWQLIFGRGLVSTPEDFGNQGELPSHPHLLDWLARDFIDNGWDVRRLLKMMVLSSTYRQSGVVSPEIRQKDPHNIWLARGPSQRLTAEMIRDNILASCDLLVRKVGGPPVKPYDLAHAYTPLTVDKGDRLYRRSLYTFWKRTSPSPFMMTLNANKREVCRLNREVTNSPLQALLLLNGTQMMEAAKHFAIRLHSQKGRDESTILKNVFQRFTSRKPTPSEFRVLKQLLEEQGHEFRSQPQLMNQLWGENKGEVSIPKDREFVSALTVLINTLMNFDESLRHQ